MDRPQGGRLCWNRERGYDSPGESLAGRRELTCCPRCRVTAGGSEDREAALQVQDALRYRMTRLVSTPVCVGGGGHDQEQCCHHRMAAQTGLKLLDAFNRWDPRGVPDLLACCCRPLPS